MSEVLIISASPNPKGSTAFYMKRVQQNLDERGIKTDYYSLGEYTIGYCKSCGHCQNQLDCSQRDDFLDVFFPLLSNEKLKAIVFGTPVYFAGISSLGKAFIDRTLPFRRNGFKLRNKIGVGFAIGGSRNGGQEISLNSIISAFLVHDMIVIGDGLTSSHFGGAAWRNDPAGYENDIVGLTTVDNLSKRLFELLQIM